MPPAAVLAPFSARSHWRSLVALICVLKKEHVFHVKDSRPFCPLGRGGDLGVFRRIRGGSAGDPRGIRGGSVGKMGDPGRWVCDKRRVLGGSANTTIRFYNIKKGE